MASSASIRPAPNPCVERQRLLDKVKTAIAELMEIHNQELEAVIRGETIPPGSNKGDWERRGNVRSRRLNNSGFTSPSIGAKDSFPRVTLPAPSRRWLRSGGWPILHEPESERYNSLRRMPTTWSGACSNRSLNEILTAEKKHPREGHRRSVGSSNVVAAWHWCSDDWSGGRS
jgi:hypothetical protein